MIAGLGNPGSRYDRTRHNAGFIVLDAVAERFGAAWKKKDGAQQAHVPAHAVVLVKPLSFMNDSGIPLQRIAAWWKAPPADLLVVSDDLDLPFGRLRMRASGGSGGHNGLKSIIAHFGEGFPRLRVGIGRGGPGSDGRGGPGSDGRGGPGSDGRGGAAPGEADADESGPGAIGHVLSRFSVTEERALPAVVEAAADAARRWLDDGPAAAMNIVNAWRPV